MATIFLATAVLAVILALVGSSIREARLLRATSGGSWQSPELVELWGFFSLLLGGVWGVISGATQPRWGWGMVIGFFAGTFFSLCIMFLLAQPPQPGMILGGCAVLVLTGLALRVLAPPQRRSS